MQYFHSFRLQGLLIPANAILFVLLTSGCGDSSGVGTTFPVSGTITLDDRPVTAPTTIILLKPDASRGNTSPFEPTGTVDRAGNYRLATKGKHGAPPGWYKVVVTATEPRGAEETGPLNHRPGPRSLLPALYGQATTTTASIEVVEKPASGAYDVKLVNQ